eukprot:GFKZ01008871.1.p1 GENE.GFKZ01008871.1~~GFKZ01008871.1.p1  ORF type:complete len:135 (-),score=4.00 GFKZ01008871.1:495-899(-)
MSSCIQSCTHGLLNVRRQCARCAKLEILNSDVQLGGGGGECKFLQRTRFHNCPLDCLNGNRISSSEGDGRFWIRSNAHRASVQKIRKFCYVKRSPVSLNSSVLEFSPQDATAALLVFKDSELLDTNNFLLLRGD